MLNKTVISALIFQKEQLISAEQRSRYTQRAVNCGPGAYGCTIGYYGSKERRGSEKWTFGLRRKRERERKRGAPFAGGPGPAGAENFGRRSAASVASGECCNQKK